MMAPRVKNSILISGACLIILGALAIAYRGDNYGGASGNTFTVTLAPEGFSPREITINKGDTVIWSTTRGVHFWPASDLHPTHAIYSAFDPKEPIEADKTWSFRFDKAGVWKYHDHLAPLYTGVVRVIDEETGGNPQGSVYCRQSAILADKQQCWDEKIERTLDQGLHQAFALVSELYNTEPEFAADCHGYTHKIGVKAYRLFAEGKNFDLPGTTSYCGFGFYHSFMEALLFDTDDLQQASAFCNFAEERLKNVTGDAKGACYHGIGHGLAGDDGGRIFKNEEALVRKPLELCEKIAPTPYFIDRCASGVFNALAIEYNRGALEIKKSDPLWFCRTLAEHYFKKPCYEEMNTMLVMLAGNDWLPAAAFIERIPEDIYAQSATRSLLAAAAKLRPEPYDFSYHIRNCHALQDRLVSWCVNGMVGGLIEGGKPGLEYVKALDFCREKELSKKERGVCFAEGLRLLGIYYSREKFGEVCRTVETEYLSYCNKG